MHKSKSIQLFWSNDAVPIEHLGPNVFIEYRWNNAYDYSNTNTMLSKAGIYSVNYFSEYCPSRGSTTQLRMHWALASCRELRWERCWMRAAMAAVVGPVATHCRRWGGRTAHWPRAPPSRVPPPPLHLHFHLRPNAAAESSTTRERRRRPLPQPHYSGSHSRGAESRRRRCERRAGSERASGRRGERLKLACALQASTEHCNLRL